MVHAAFACDFGDLSSHATVRICTVYKPLANFHCVPQEFLHYPKAVFPAGVFSEHVGYVVSTKYCCAEICLDFEPGKSRSYVARFLHYVHGSRGDPNGRARAGVFVIYWVAENPVVTGVQDVSEGPNVCLA